MDGTLVAERYRITRRLGAGGMATVWAATDERLGRPVALKRLHVPDGPSAKRLEREARIGASLRHPALVTVFDVLSVEHGLLLVMELVDGGSLADRLQVGRLEPQAALPVLRDVAGALDHAHAKGVVHRDVKPANILIGRDGRARLADLGIATALESTRLTAAGDLLGTPAYLAPEQVAGEDATPASDRYAFAAVAFETLSGRKAHPGASALEIMHAVRRDPTPDLRAVWPQAPPPAAQALARGMAVEPSDRPASAVELVDELAAAFAPRPPAAAPAPREAPAPTVRLPVQRRRDRRPLIAFAALVAVVAAVVAVLTSGGDGGRPQPQAAASATATRTATPTAASTKTATPAATAAATTVAARAGASPASAVRGFYERAAAGDFARAWLLAGPQMRAAFGGSLAQFERDMASLQSIDFQQLDVTSRQGGQATVTVRTVAQHTDHVDHCSGALRATRSAAGVWQVEPAGLHCS
jgi:hypothetical protein